MQEIIKSIEYMRAVDIFVILFVVVGAGGFLIKEFFKNRKHRKAFAERLFVIHTYSKLIYFLEDKPFITETDIRFLKNRISWILMDLYYKPEVLLYLKDDCQILNGIWGREKCVVHRWNGNLPDSENTKDTRLLKWTVYRAYISCLHTPKLQDSGAVFAKKIKLLFNVFEGKYMYNERELTCYFLLAFASLRVRHTRTLADRNALKSLCCKVEAWMSAFRSDNVYLKSKIQKCKELVFMG